MEPYLNLSLDVAVLVEGEAEAGAEDAVGGVRRGSGDGATRRNLTSVVQSLEEFFSPQVRRRFFLLLLCVALILSCACGCLLSPAWQSYEYTCESCKHNVVDTSRVLRTLPRVLVCATRTRYALNLKVRGWLGLAVAATVFSTRVFSGMCLPMETFPFRLSTSSALRWSGS